MNFFEIVTLIQTKKIKRVPIVCYGREYWGELDAFIRKKLLEEHKAIDADDMDIYHIVDSVDEAYDYIVAKHYLLSGEQTPLRN
jgi:predicted Rossmann-fold nucleotide-binding protein